MITRANDGSVNTQSASRISADSVERETEHKMLRKVVILTPRARIIAAIGRVAEAHNTTLKLVLGHKQTTALGLARADAMAMLERDFPRLTQEHIGRIFDRTQSSVRQILERRAAMKAAKR